MKINKSYIERLSMKMRGMVDDYFLKVRFPDGSRENELLTKDSLSEQ